MPDVPLVPEHRRLIPNSDDVPWRADQAGGAPDAPDEGRAGPPSLWREWRLPAALVPTWEAAEAAVLEQLHRYNGGLKVWT